MRRSPGSARGPANGGPADDGATHASRLYSVQVLDRIMGVLQCFTAEQPEVRLSEVSSRLGLHKSTAYRLLEALCSHGIVAHDPDTGRYHLGLKLFELGALAVSRLDLSRCAQGPLEQLVERTGETAHLGVLDGAEVVCLARAESPHALRMPSAVGRRNPAYCTGMGKALLAHVPEEALDQYLTHTLLTRRTHRTIVDPGELRKELRVVRARGWAVDDEEIHPGIRCVAAPVRDHRGDIAAAVSVAGPCTRMPKERLAEFAIQVIEVARAISQSLGHQRGPVSPRRPAERRPGFARNDR